ncbi:MAG: aggregation factor core [Pseudomonadota bacterium]
MLRTVAFIAALTANIAAADVVVQFTEGAPKDRFTITNDGECALGKAEVSLDLSAAPAGLIFDVTGQGAGVQVFQPFEVVAGANRLAALPRVLDGDTAVTLALTGLAARESVAFTIDVDDTAGGREITVSGSEINGARVRMDIGGAQVTAGFDKRAIARLVYDSCAS